MDESSRVLEGKPGQPECPVRDTRQHIADGKAGGAEAGVHSDFGSRGISRDGNPVAVCYLHDNPPSVCFFPFSIYQPPQHRFGRSLRSERRIISAAANRSHPSQPSDDVASDLSDAIPEASRCPVKTR